MIRQLHPFSDYGICSDAGLAGHGTRDGWEALQWDGAGNGGAKVCHDSGVMEPTLSNNFAPAHP